MPDPRLTEGREYWVRLDTTCQPRCRTKLILFEVRSRAEDIGLARGGWTCLMLKSWEELAAIGPHAPLRGEGFVKLLQCCSPWAPRNPPVAGFKCHELFRVARTLKFPAKKRRQARGQHQELLGYNEDVPAVTGLEGQGRWRWQCVDVTCDPTCIVLSKGLLFPFYFSDISQTDST